MGNVIMDDGVVVVVMDAGDEVLAPEVAVVVDPTLVGD